MSREEPTLRPGRYEVHREACNKVVTIQAKDIDRNDRIVADVVLADGTSLNRESVKQGLAWWFFRYSNDVTLKTLEMEARDGKRGLWRDPIPIPPWVFRKIQRKQLPDLADFPYPGIAPAGALANKRSHMYPDARCKGYAGMLERKNVMTFATAEDAEAAGYHMASDCPRRSGDE